MLRLPQNEQLKVLKMLCLPRNHYVKALPEKNKEREKNPKRIWRPLDGPLATLFCMMKNVNQFLRQAIRQLQQV